MVLLVTKLANSLKLPSKLDNHHHPPEEAISASLQAFRSDISNFSTKLLSNLKPGSEFLSLGWFQLCLEQLPVVNRAFAKLVVEIDYPMSKWEASSIEEYLNYSLNLLDLLNSINSAISHLSQARVSLSHASSLLENSPAEAIKRLKEIKPKGNKILEGKEMEKHKEIRNCKGKENAFQEALLILNSFGLWVCSVVLSGISSDLNPFMKMRNSGNGFVQFPVAAMDSGLCKKMMEKKGVVKELKEVNDAVVLAKGRNADSANELNRRLEVLEKELKRVKEEADKLFSEVLAGRNELLDILRHKSKSKT